MSNVFIRTYRCLREHRPPSKAVTFFSKFWSRSLKYRNTPYSYCEKAADTEIHSLLMHKHVGMYILAIKSFLRFYHDVAVVVHDSGDLKLADKKLLEENIVNIRIIALPEADAVVEPLIGPEFSRVRKINKLAMKLFDILLLSPGKKVIILDSDILFFSRPDEVINWITQDNNTCLYVSEWPQEAMKKTTQISLLEKETSHKIDGSFNSGFLCLFNDFTMPEIKRAYDMAFKYKVYPMEFENEIFEQAAFGVLTALRRSKPLESSMYKVFSGEKIFPEVKMLHFNRYRRFWHGTYMRSCRKLFAELRDKE